MTTELLLLTCVADDKDPEYDERITMIVPSLDFLIKLGLDPENLPLGYELLRGAAAEKYASGIQL